MTAFAALLRGINVGGKNMIPMTELKTSFSTLGLEDVVSYLQSGNVVFRSSGKAVDLAKQLERQISRDFGLEVPVILRTGAELSRIAERNPFLGDESQLSKLFVVFLDRRPAANAVRELDPDRSPPDRFDSRGRELYLHTPNGAGRSKLTTDYFERRLGARATARNWNTVLQLVAFTHP